MNARSYTLAAITFALGVVVGLVLHPVKFDNAVEKLTLEVEAQRKLIDLYEAERSDMAQFLKGTEPKGFVPEKDRQFKP